MVKALKLKEQHENFFKEMRRGKKLEKQTEFDATTAKINYLREAGMSKGPSQPENDEILTRATRKQKVC